MTPNFTAPKSIVSLWLALWLISSLSTKAGDWPHWLGPNGNNKVAAAGNFDPDLSNWKIAWQKNVGLGYSSITVVNGKAYTMGHNGKTGETVFCFDATNGKQLWSKSYKADLIPKMHVGGPNASVTIIGENAYAVSKDGQVFCLNAHSGETIWEGRLTEILDMEVPNWGFGSSPVEYKGDILIAAGKVVALDKNTGRPSWISKENRKSGYGSPVVFRHGSTDYIAAMDEEGLSILNASDGTEVARHAQRVKFAMNATTPAVINNGRNIFFYSNVSSELLSFDGKSLKSQWADRKLQNALSGSVLIDNALYGLNGNHKSKKTRLYSRNIDTGNEHWSVPDFGYGSLIAIGSTLVILTEEGDLVTAAANTGKYQEISRKKLLDSICWTNPTYGEGKIFVRNDQGVLIVLERA